jgi:hypothetical protein
MLISCVITFIHYVILVFIVCTPFATTQRDVLIIHWMALTTILVHWLTNNNACVLTEIEHRLRASDGRPHHRSETFMHRVTAPFFTTMDEPTMEIYHIKCTVLFYILCGINLMSMR